MTDLIDEAKQICPIVLIEILEKIYNINSLLCMNPEKSAEYRLGYAKGVTELITMLKTEVF
jgi:hypothetical protein